MSNPLINNIQIMIIDQSDGVRYDSLRRACTRVEDQYACLIRQGHRTVDTARVMLREIEMLRFQLDIIDKQAKKLLEEL